MADVVGTIAAAAQLAVASKKGFRSILDLQPEFGSFWKSFSRLVVRHRRDLPLAELREWRFQVSFIRSACALMRGERSALDDLRVEWFAVAAVKRPNDSTWSEAEVVAALEDFARRAAVEAVEEFPALARLAQTALLEGALAEQRTEIAHLTKQNQQMAVLMQSLSSQIEALKRGLESAGLVAETASVVSEANSYGVYPSRTPSERQRKLELAAKRRSEAIRLFVDRLAGDPDVAEVAQEPIAVKYSGFWLRPDLAVRDKYGVNWFVEFRQGREAARQAAQAEFADITRALGGEWRYLSIRLSRPEDVTAFRKAVAVGGQLSR